MPIAFTQALDEAAGVAATKVRQARGVPRYLVLSVYAGAFVGVAVGLLVSVSAPLAKMRAEFEEDDDDEPSLLREHMRRMLDRRARQFRGRWRFRVR
jgi:hypothetical protein